MDGKKTIYSKLVEVRQEIGGMEKAGTNTLQNYNYFSDDQIAEKFRSLFNKHGIAFEYSSKITGNREISSTKAGTKQFVTDVEVEYKFVDIETGDFVSGFACGSGNDTGDKGVYKAITGAVKYIFMKTFQISTGDDPEKDEVKERKPGQKAEPKKPIQKNDPNFGDENNDIPHFPSDKPVFDSSTFNAFKGSVEQGSFDISDPQATIDKIKDKYDIDDKFVLEIKGFIASRK